MSETAPVILTIEDETSQLKALASFLHKRNYQVIEAENQKTAIEQFQSHAIDLVLTDMKLPDGDGESILEHIKQIRPDVPVIIMTAYGNTTQAVAAMRKGASDYITKPLDLNELDLIIQRELERSVLISENRRLREIIENRGHVAGLITASPLMQDVLNTALRAAASDAGILILGESGTGKEVLARAVHAASPRATKPFVPIHCAALPEGIVQSELFGHEKGAFTGATARREGRFELADGGTIFIDEVGDIPLNVQVQLLRVLQERTFERVGGNQSIHVDVRIVAATNKNLQEAIKKGDFREDLFYRLGIITIEIPPLRKRREDIPPLIQHFLKKYAPGRFIDISREAMDRLMKHRWPGNIRELENLIERAVVLARGNLISTRDLPSNIQPDSDDTNEIQVQSDRTLPELVADLEKTLIQQALLKSDGNQSQAARSLGITERNLRYKLKKYDPFIPE
ncbi:MAG: sigma-54-dependent Fis family transcriptional regulator [Candidatus Omnitrophota bacterium]|jgi:two-component system NtrC family response regulator|nr:MAG: sigma-54-dependent Fis family transcriptional regulator [Candidatus Omnitrophota bacterium]